MRRWRCRIRPTKGPKCSTWIPSMRRSCFWQAKAGRQFRSSPGSTRLSKAAVKFSNQSRSVIRHNLAIGYLRLGEQENCLTNHTIDSCLMPIQAAGVHKIQRGSRRAAELLTEQLNEFPDDLKARWLLNLAYMTLGEYPARVPSKWLIPA